MNRLASSAQLRNSLLRWLLFLVPAVVLIGMVSGIASGSSAQDPWFAALVKPSFFPPPVVFSIVWPILYALMGAALALVCAAWGARWRAAAIVAFLAQFALNLAWSPVFFGQHRIGIALGMVVALALVLAVTLWLFWKVRRVAAVLLLPYLAWVLFAGALNWEVLRLNPGADGTEASNAVQRIEL